MSYNTWNTRYITTKLSAAPPDSKKFVGFLVPFSFVPLDLAAFNTL
jgi:hypothetical protein